MMHLANPHLKPKNRWNFTKVICCMLLLLKYHSAESSEAIPELIKLNARDTNAFASLSFEYPLYIDDKSPEETRTILNTKCIDEKLNPLKTSEAWMSNFHITVIGFPNIAVENLKKHQFKAIIHQYLELLRKSILSGEELTYDKELLIEKPWDILLKPSENMRNSIVFLGEEGVKIFSEHTPNELRGHMGAGIHISLNANMKELDPIQEKSNYQGVKDRLIAIFQRTPLKLGNPRATLLYHSDIW